MSDHEIRLQIMKFIDKACYCSSVRQARKLNAEIDDFCDKYYVTNEQLRPFVESGYGEKLEMLARCKIED